MHRHHSPQPCDICQDWPDWARHLSAHLNYLENAVTEVNANQQHMNDDIAAIGAAAATAFQELKDQIAAGVAAQDLDFTAADALVASTQAEATADAPAPAAPPVDDNPPADGSAPVDDGSTPAA